MGTYGKTKDKKLRRAPDFLGEFEKLRTASLRPITEIAIMGHEIDTLKWDSNPDDSMDSYTHGLLKALTMTFEDTKDAALCKAHTISRLCDEYSIRAGIKTGKFGDLIRLKPHWSRLTDGSVRAYEWALSLKSNLGINIQAERAKIPHRLTPK